MPKPTLTPHRREAVTRIPKGIQVRRTIITIEHLAAGQPRPHADSRYHARITAERHGVYTNDTVIPCYMDEGEITALTRLFVHNFYDEPEWYQSRLFRATAVNPKTILGTIKSGEWEVLVVEPYLD